MSNNTQKKNKSKERKRIPTVEKLYDFNRFNAGYERQHL